MIALDPVKLFDMGFGPYMVSVAPPGAGTSPSSTLKRKALGKIPARLAQAGWTGIDFNDPKFRCHDYATAKKWRDEWGANVGFVASDGYAFIDNDQGMEFSAALQRAFALAGKIPLRRFVLDPRHHRDAFLVRVLDFVGDGAALTNQDLSFKKGAALAKVQILARGKQAVVSGTHPETKSPYVWDDFPVGTIDDVPSFSEKEFYQLINFLMVELTSAGWVSGAPVVSGASVAIAAASAPIANLKKVLDDADELLSYIPNRDIPKAQWTAVDYWLDEYDNWVKVAYALAAYLGLRIAGTSDAEALWNAWSDGKHQAKQRSEDLWRSAVKQPWRFGEIGLLKIIKDIPGAMPPEDFPPADPNDPLFKALPTPFWNDLKRRWAHYLPNGGFLDIISNEIVDRRTFCDHHRQLAKALTIELRPEFKHRKSARLPTVADLYCEQKDKLTVSGTTYAPGEPRLLPDEHDPEQRIFNRWKPSETSPQKGVTEAQIAPWLNHLEYVLGSTTERVRFVKWCAFVAQFPLEKPNWHYLVMGLSGLGKDSMLAPVKAAVGENNCKDGTASQVNSDFNDAFEAKLLIVGETHQLKWDAQGMMGRLKQALATPPEYLWINQKHQRRYKIPNRIAAVMFSNDANPLPMEPGERRINVVNARGIVPKVEAYHKGFWDWLKQGGTEMVAGYLLALSLTDVEKQNFSGGVAPQSGAKDQVESMNQHPAKDALDELIDDARAGTGPFASGLATVEQLSEHIKMRGVHQPSSQMVRGLLLDMEQQNRGVSRVRIDPAKSHQCGVVGIPGKSARLWSLVDKAPDGREWKDWSNAELLARWQGKPPPKSATILSFPKDADGEEMI